MGILAWLALLGERLLEALGLLDAIQGELEGLAQQATVGEILTKVDLAVGELQDDEHGLVSITEAIDHLKDIVEALNAPVLAAIAALPVGSSLPTSSAITDDVWGQLDPISEGGAISRGDELGRLLIRADFHDQANASGVVGAPGFLLYTDPASADAFTWPLVYPNPDWADILPSDTPLTWLNRNTPGITWYAWSDDYNVYGVQDSGPSQSFLAWGFNVTRPDWTRLQQGVSAAPPVWPGLAGVTLGTPQQISDSAIIDGPMHGILLTIDAVAPGSGQWVVDSFTSWRYAGYVVFLSAEGHADTTQYLGPDDNVFCPRTMHQADSCVVYLNKATTVTVTPWTLA